jgi:hypothetical protein
MQKIASISNVFFFSVHFKYLYIVLFFHGKALGTMSISCGPASLLVPTDIVDSMTTATSDGFHATVTMATDDANAVYLEGESGIAGEPKSAGKIRFKRNLYCLILTSRRLYVIGALRMLRTCCVLKCMRCCHTN